MSVVTDARGRKITVRELDPADMLDLIETMPSCDSPGTWMRYAQVMHSVAQIDDVPVLPPRSRDQVRAIAKRLGNDGFAAVAEYVHGSASTPEADQAEAEAIKN